MQNFSHFHFLSSNNNNNDKKYDNKQSTIIHINNDSHNKLKHLSIKTQMIPEEQDGIIIHNQELKKDSLNLNDNCLCVLPMLLTNLFENIIKYITPPKQKFE